MNISKTSALLLVSMCAFGLHAQTLVQENTQQECAPVTCVVSQEQCNEQGNVQDVEQFVLDQLAQYDTVDREQLKELFARKFEKLSEAELAIIFKLLDKSDAAEAVDGEQALLEQANMSLPKIGSALMKMSASVVVLAGIDYWWGDMIASSSVIASFVRKLNELNKDGQAGGRKDDDWAKSLWRAGAVVIGGGLAGGLTGECLGDTVALLSFSSDEERSAILACSKTFFSALASMTIALAVIDEDDPKGWLSGWYDAAASKSDEIKQKAKELKEAAKALQKKAEQVAGAGGGGGN
ncbi:MAG: hypothetical protein H6679_05240 [Epsilonproteobacteria bacterium]|nr:hypothetical protein [Campylobacterota bacterium]